MCRESKTQGVSRESHMSHDDFTKNGILTVSSHLGLIYCYPSILPFVSIPVGLLIVMMRTKKYVMPIDTSSLKEPVKVRIYCSDSSLSIDSSCLR
jgi:hypothetical protein